MTTRASPTPANVGTFAVVVGCRCPGRTPPLRVPDEAAAMVRGMGGLPPQLVFQTWRCPDCKVTVPITAAMMRLAKESETF